MGDRLNLGSGVRELKLGSSFNASNPRMSTSFHTLKYDFKPASVDISKIATLDVSSNNQVTVTVPHLDTSGTPHTVYKGNHRGYGRECVLIIDKVTGEITLEKLDSNIQVKKTRENPSKPIPSQSPMASQRASLENSTQRIISKTKVSTGVRKKAIGGLVQRYSPIQGSPSQPHHKSPQQAPAWNANNNQSTLPSIPLIEMDDDILPTSSALPLITEQPAYQQPQQTNQHCQQPQQHLIQPSTTTNNYQSNVVSNNGSISSNTASNNQDYHHNNHTYQQLPVSQPNANQLGSVVGVLSSSDSSSDDSDSTDSSDSEDDNEESTVVPSNQNMNNAMQIDPLPDQLLHEDLCLSESNSDSDN